MRAYRGYLFFLLPSVLLGQNGSTVDGVVTDTVTHLGVSGVGVSLWNKQGVRYNATTDSAGSFRIIDVPPGEYRSRYEKSGFVPLGTPRMGQPALRVGLGGSSRVAVELARFATLRGRVLDPEGKPTAKAKVGVGAVGTFTYAETDSDGWFTLTELRPGTYTMWATAEAKPDSTSQKATRTQTLPTYFRSAMDRWEAERIVVWGGADLAGYEIRLRTSPVFRVRGVVLDEVGKPVPKANVRLLKPSADKLLSGLQVFLSSGIQFFVNTRGPEVEAARMADQDGNFEFPAVRPGEWWLEAELAQHDSPNNFYFVSTGIVRTMVSDRDVGNIELRFESSFPVDVVFDWADDKSPHGTGSVQLIRADSPIVPSSSRKATGSAPRFEHVVPGRYRIVPGPEGPVGFYPTAVLVNGSNVLGQEVELIAPATVQVVYKPNPGTVRGKVEQGGGATVLLWPQSAEIPDRVTSVSAGPNGAFEINNIPPGNYSIVAFDSVDFGAPVSTDFVLSAVAMAPRIQVEETRTVLLTLPVTHWQDY